MGLQFYRSLLKYLIHFNMIIFEKLFSTIKSLLKRISRLFSDKKPKCGQKTDPKKEPHTGPEQAGGTLRPGQENDKPKDPPISGPNEGIGYKPRDLVSMTPYIQSYDSYFEDALPDFSGERKVSYEIISSQVLNFPLIRAPKKESRIKFPEKGRYGLRGSSEKRLCELIKEKNLPNFFDNLCLYDRSGTAYSPDLAYIDVSNKMFIDIEIDEPYDGIIRNPIHYRLNDSSTIDDERNKTFCDRGWTVIRFSERQIVEHLESCLKEIYKLIDKMKGTITLPDFLRSVPDLSPQRIWTKEEAETMSSNKEREKYLNIQNFIPARSDAPHMKSESSRGKEFEKIGLSPKKTPVSKPSIEGVTKPQPHQVKQHPKPISSIPEAGNGHTPSPDNRDRKVTTNAPSTTAKSPRGYA